MRPEASVLTVDMGIESQSRGGYGIGLSIAENLVEKYNGSIRADWKNGMISFTCTLK